MRPLGWPAWLDLTATTHTASAVEWPHVLIAAVGWCLLILIPLALVTDRQRQHLSGWLPPLLTTFLLGLAWTMLTVPIISSGSIGADPPLLLILAEFPGYIPEHEVGDAIGDLAAGVFQLTLSVVFLIAAVVLNVVVRQVDLSRQERNDSQRQ